MPIVETHKLSQSARQSTSDNLQTYCGLDCCVTMEVFEEISAIPHHSSGIYAFERALQAPYLDIIRRGFLVDELSRQRIVNDPEIGLRPRLARLQSLLDRLASEVWDKRTKSSNGEWHALNPRSPAQLKDFFYSTMHLPEVWLSQKGVKKLSTNREALEKLEVYLYARPFTSIILSIRDISKQLEVLESDIDSDSRFRTSYNIAGTETGRPSSSTNAFGTGGNAQNIAPALRSIFISDPGYKLCVIDLEQVEARDVGWFCGVLFDDWSYLDACESGDLHTNNARRVCPERQWTGVPHQDRKLAEEQFYREFSFRDMSKRGGHLTNYRGTAWMMSRALKIPIAVAEMFQARYVLGAPGIDPAFPCIPRWLQWTAEQIQLNGALTTPFGRTRHFFGRPGDDATIREAIAFLPQSTTADRMNLGLWRVWRYMPEVQLLAQTYDSITFQYLESANESDIIGRALELIRVELVAPNRPSYIVPGEAKIGWNWGACVTQSDIDRAKSEGKRPPRLNPEGLVKWKPGSDKRTRASGLGRIMI